MAVGGGSWLQPDIDEQDRSVPGRGASRGRPEELYPEWPDVEELYPEWPDVHGRPQSSTAFAPPHFASYQQSPYHQWAPTEFSHISAEGHTKQHVGHVYNSSSHSHYYNAPEREANDTSREQRGRALLKAAKEGQRPVVRRLLGAGADVEYTDPENGYSALHYASQSGYEDVVELLVEEGADVNLLSECYGTPLHLAALRGHLAVARFLLSCRSDITACGSDVGQPLHCAIFHGYAEICAELLKRGAHVNDRGDLHYGTMQSVSCGEHTLGARRGHMDCFPIDVAIDRESLELVKLLVHKGAKMTFPCPRWSPPWMHGDMSHLPGRENVIEGIRPVIRAACLKDSAILSFLLDSGASIYTDDGRGMNAVMYAARSGSASCLEDLVSRLRAMEIVYPPRNGAMSSTKYILQRCNDDSNALEMAVQGGHTKCVHILCESSDLMLYSQSGSPKALHLACSQLNLDMILTLLNAGFDVNSRDWKGYTPIVLAMVGFHEHLIPDVAIALAERGAALNTTFIDGRTFAQSLLERFASGETGNRLFRHFITVALEQLCESRELSGVLSQEVWPSIKQHLLWATEASHNNAADRHLLHALIRDGDWVSALVLERLGACRGEMLWYLARNIGEAEFFEVGTRLYRSEGIAYRAGEREYRLAIKEGKLKAL